MDRLILISGSGGRFRSLEERIAAEPDTPESLHRLEMLAEEMSWTGGGSWQPRRFQAPPAELRVIQGGVRTRG